MNKVLGKILATSKRNNLQYIQLRIKVMIRKMLLKLANFQICQIRIGCLKKY